METFDRLWQGLAVKYLTPGERGAFFGWLMKTQFEGAGSGSLLSDDKASEIFQSRMCNSESMKFETLSLDAFKCFEAFFTFCNGVAGKLSSKDPSDDQVATRDTALLGVDALWSILAQVRGGEGEQ